MILTANPFVHASLTLSDLSVNASNNLQVHSSTYTFVTADIGTTMFIVNTTGGWTACAQFTIASLSGGDAILTASPGATGSTGGSWHFDNYNLNTTTGGGAACRGHGVPSGWPGNPTVIAYPDMGAIQHQDAGGGGNLIVNIES